MTDSEDDVVSVPQHRADLIEYKINENAKSECAKLFLVKFVNGQRTQYRRCFRYETEIKAPDGSTSGMNKHARSCTGKRGRARSPSQPIIPFKIAANTDQNRKLLDVGRLVFEDRIPINRIVKSTFIQQLLKKSGYPAATTDGINEALETKYQELLSKIKGLIVKRPRNQIICISFDKWTSQTQKKYIGVYLYVNKMKICLGLINYRGFCGNEEICVHLKKLLNVFGLLPSEVSVAITDCGSDVQKACETMGWFNFPCLPHVINLCVKKYIFVSDGDECDDFVFDEDNDDISDAEIEYNKSLCNSDINAVRKIVKKINGSALLRDRFSDLQQSFNRPLKNLILDNATRWNSLFDMLERFIDQKDVLYYWVRILKLLIGQSCKLFVTYLDR